MRLAAPLPLLAAVAVSALTACATARPVPTSHGPLPFIEDDYALALKTARAQKRPLFVEAWAPWCPSCRYLKSTVLQDERLRSLADGFVWLSIDTELPKNAAFVAKYPIELWPTLLVIDPARETPVLRWLGTVSVEQLAALLTGSDVLLA